MDDSLDQVWVDNNAFCVDFPRPPPFLEQAPTFGALYRDASVTALAAAQGLTILCCISAFRSRTHQEPVDNSPGKTRYPPTPRPSSLTQLAGSLNIYLIADRLSEWRFRHRHLAAEAERATMRHDLQVLLSYVRDCPVVGTRGTSNMRLKDVWEVTSRFAKPPQLQLRVGDKLSQPRSETDVRPLHFLRVLA